MNISITEVYLIQIAEVTEKIFLYPEVSFPLLDQCASFLKDKIFNTPLYCSVFANEYSEDLEMGVRAFSLMGRFQTKTRAV